MFLLCILFISSTWTLQMSRLDQWTKRSCGCHSCLFRFFARRLHHRTPCQSATTHSSPFVAWVAILEVSIRTRSWTSLCADLLGGCHGRGRGSGERYVQKPEKTKKTHIRISLYGDFVFSI